MEMVVVKPRILVLNRGKLQTMMTVEEEEEDDVVVDFVCLISNKHLLSNQVEPTMPIYYLF